MAKVKDLVELVFGTNQARIEIDHDIDEFYDKTTFEYDYEHLNERNLDVLSSEGNKSGKMYTQTGDVLISTSSQLATVVSEHTANKILTINFIKVNCNERLILKGYFIYLFNMNKTIKKEKERLAQTTGVQRITATILNDIELPLPDIGTQQKIVDLYLKMIDIKRKSYKYAELIEKTTYNLLEKFFDNDEINKKKE
ncbi:Type I restriction-modification system specificity subunit [Alteracholeplasma palmae J233]|uniref:Type I restriction-modification system specificity subunit n=1 Tax=Alteracholeplasma palmae (strain ATCC 49389 / J233) TaxID=1318466 RepID=U4KK44_ALTPJ|nr:restriction endonuclease subunit S [Alteracholeplasma palmae]CCV63887.1 Type I restriction-modification system specificity subunit [Alteracholeplasma palmae J233]